MSEGTDTPRNVSAAEPLSRLSSASGAWVWDLTRDRLYADARFASLCGLDPEEAKAGMSPSRFVAGVLSEDQLRVRIALAGVRHGSDTFAKDYRVRGRDGTVRWVSARGQVERGADEVAIWFTGLLVDITDQKRVEEQLRIAQTAGGVGTFEHTDGFGTADVSDQFCRLLGLQSTDALPVRTINAVVVDGEPLIVRTGGRQAGEAYSELRIRRADDGGERWLARRGEYRDGADGGDRFIGVIYDITPAKTAEAELRLLTRTLEDRVAERTRERDRVWNRAHDLFLVMSRDRRYLAVNPAWKRLLGYEEYELLGREHGALAHPDDQAAREETFREVLQGGRVDNFDVRVRAKDGAYRWINWTLIPEGDEIYGMGRDVTDRKQLEDQLRQSQKMEAVGQLTGGLAHDFNNMLTGIMGGLDIARRRIDQGRPEEAAAFLETATTAAERAAALTHRLLAFARRQSLDAQVLDVNALIGSVEEMLRRTLGEQVALKLALDAELWPARADANQLESAILNLAINARDAMPNGGAITIATSRQAFASDRQVGGDVAAAGDYLVIEVADTGEGMPPDILAKVFDPFFTTKPIGQGTGLGLSMVYGFVRQSGGHVEIDSRLGAGARVRLYLPRHVGEDPAMETARPTDAPLGAGERVLLVEDDPQVRMLVRTVLQELGYDAIEAVDGFAALRIMEDAGEIDLLITDVGLPGLNGRQLAEVVRQTLPELPVLFMTGYAPDAADRGAFLADGMQMISKPFTVEVLATRLREILSTR